MSETESNIESAVNTGGDGDGISDGEIAAAAILVPAALVAAATFYVLQRHRTKEQRDALATKIGLGPAFRRLSSLGTSMSQLTVKNDLAASPDGGAA